MEYQSKKLELDRSAMDVTRERDSEAQIARRAVELENKKILGEKEGLVEKLKQVKGGQ